MIDLTPLEIRRKKGDFPRAVRGYQRDLVDDFLELVADRLEELNHEYMELRDRHAKMEEELATFRERDEALTGALVSAQEARSRMQEDATKEADMIRQKAEIEADKARSAAAHARERELQGLRQLRARRMELIRSYRGFLERELKELGVLARTLELEEADRESDTGEAAAGEDSNEPGSLLSSIVDEEK